MKKESITEI